MQKVLSAQQMSEVDRLSTSEFGIPSIELMENAAKAVLDAAADLFGGKIKGKHCVILCGKGNNGGDGAALARLLVNGGASVRVLLVGRVEETKGDARINFEKLDKEILREIVDDERAASVWDEFADRVPDLIVDAVFGTGLDRPVDGIHKTVLEGAQEFTAGAAKRPYLLSIDIPSGLDSDRATPIGFCFKPDLTVTFTAPKIANVMPPASREQGRLTVKDIGSPAELVERSESQTFVFEKSDVKAWLESTAFTPDSFKKLRGSLLIFAGSGKYPGAAVLAANGAIRSGVGIVTVAVPQSAYEAVAARVLPEVMVCATDETSSGAFNSGSVSQTESILAAADAVLVGCGITSNEFKTQEFVRNLVSERNFAIVSDADGLNCLSPFEQEGSSEFPIVLTPHEGEFLRLTGGSGPIVNDQRIDVVRDFAVGHCVICVLKGERTLVASPDGRVVIVPVGNPGLGKAGNGDNLAGIVAGFVAQQMRTAGSSEVFEAAASAVFVAGLAGDIAEREFGKRVMTASDVRDYFSKAFKEVAG